MSKRKLAISLGSGRLLSASEQLQWELAAESFLQKVEFDEYETARRMYPLGKMAHIIIDPEVTFGLPQIVGIRTETIDEAFASGESIAAISQSWDLPRDAVEAALQWESSIGRRAA